MTTPEFNAIVTKLTDNINATLIKKAAEYNLEEDRLGVFKRAGHLQKEPASKALLGMMTKHITSIYDYVCGETKMTEVLAREKIGDALNYLILLYAVMSEEGFAEQKK